MILTPTAPTAPTAPTSTTDSGSVDTAPTDEFDRKVTNSDGRLKVLPFRNITPSPVGEYPIVEREAYDKFVLNLGYLTSAAFEDPSNRILEWASPVQEMVRNALLETPLRETVEAYPKMRLYISKKDKLWFYFTKVKSENEESYAALGVCVTNYNNYSDGGDRGLKIESYDDKQKMMSKKTVFTAANCLQRAKWAAFQAERSAKHAAVHFLNTCDLPTRQPSTALAECKPMKRKQDKYDEAPFSLPPMCKRQMATAR